MLGKFFYPLVYHLSRIFVAVLLVFLCHIFFIANTKNSPPFKCKHTRLGISLKIFRLNHFFVEQTQNKSVRDRLAEKFHQVENQRIFSAVV